MKPKRAAHNITRVVVELLTSPRGWRVDQLREELGVEARTYRKYREILQEDGAVEALTGRDDLEVVEVAENDGKYLRFVESKAIVDQKALERFGALHMASQLIGIARDTPLSAELGSAMEDLKKAVKKRPGLRDRLARVERMLCYVPSAPKKYAGKGELIRALFGATLGRRHVRLAYKGLDDDAARDWTVEPYTIVLYRDALYVIAKPSAPAADNVIRTFAIDRMERVEKLETTFTYPQDFKPSDYFEGSFGIFREPGGKRVQVELLFVADHRLQRYLRERDWHSTQKFVDLPDGRLRMTFSVTSLAEVAPWVRSFGRAAEVVKPAGVDWDSIGLGLQ